MKNKPIILTVLFLCITIGNYSRFIESMQIRTVEFLSILAIGISIGVLLTQIFSILRNK